MLLVAQSLTPLVRAWLRTTRHARIMHVFERACNLIDNDGSVISIVTPDIGSGPFNIVAPPVDFTRWITPADPVHVSPHRLHIGSLEIDLFLAQEWNPCPDWRRLRDQRDQLLVQGPLLQAVLQEHAPASSFAHFVVDLSSPESVIEARLLSAARQQWDMMARGLRVMDREACLTGAANLAGLGGGLTPAGDDWLLGCALAAQIGLTSPPVAGLALDAVRDAVSKTSAFSAAWLCAAVHGACHERWHMFFEQCLTADGEGIYRAAQHLVQQGHSSGADALAGYLAFLMMPHDTKGPLIFRTSRPL